jgi:predicted 3-demethylubiquinone-9 3-methyltransferase (glyoxalase superfamily)
MNKNTICLWYDHDAEEAARFYARTFPDSTVGAVHRAPSDFPGGKARDVLTVEFTVCGVPCLGLNGGNMFKHNEAFSRSPPTTRRRPTVIGTRSSATVARRARAAGARTNGACRGRSPRAS